MNKLALPLLVFCIWALNSQPLDAQLIRRSCVDCSKTVNQVSNTIVHQPVSQTVQPVLQPVVVQEIVQPVIAPIVEHVHHDHGHHHHDHCDAEKCKRLIECEAELEQAYTSIEEYENKVHGYQKKLIDLTEKLKCCEETSHQLGHDVQNLHKKIQSLTAENKEVQGQLVNAESNLTQVSTELKNSREKVNELRSSLDWHYWLFISAAILAGLLLLFSLWLLSKLAGARRENASLSSNLRQLDTQLHDARATQRLAESRVHDLERDLIRCQSSYEQCVRDSAVSRERIISATNHTHHNNCCDRNGTFIYNPHHPHREGESPFAAPQAVQSPQAPQAQQDPFAPQVPQAQTPQAQTPQAPQSQTPQAPQSVAPLAPQSQSQLPQIPQAQAPQAQAPQAPQAQSPQSPQSMAPMAPQAQSPVATPQTDQDNKSDSKSESDVTPS